ncbi:MAG: GntR family transcriptional regulator [Chloroflexaceae bacterium]|nr:GntR family transcriptional regulator [Chloroflexaceae bacterium]NJL33596.1 GntR family transcriptional regulator [Chloroflexaceae bacterium]NJO05665.1 GntR family transcriptional regulator [Chloroflexaceae bacterium]
MSTTSPSAPFKSPPSLRESVFTHLKGLIIHNKLLPRAIIRVERLATELGVSRTPVREALLLLEGEGLVSSTPNHSFVVTEISPRDVDDVYKVRALLESQAAHAAAELVPDADVERLVAQMEQVYNDLHCDDFATCLTFDIDLHTTILRYSNNPVLTQMAISLAERSLRIRHLTDTAPHLYAIITDEHRAILDALCMRDAEAAYQAMHTHLSNGRVRTRGQLEQVQALAARTADE